VEHQKASNSQHKTQAWNLSLSQHLVSKITLTSISIFRANKTHTQIQDFGFVSRLLYFTAIKQKKKKETAFLCKLSLKKGKFLLINPVQTKRKF